MQTDNAVVRTLQRAADKLGGVGPLARRLHCSVTEVERWLSGVPPPPKYMVFLGALDIVSPPIHHD